MLRKSLPLQVANQLFEEILKNGRYAPGDRLPGEIELSASLGVSRSTLREAIKILESRGVLRVRRGHGTFVAGVPEAVSEPSVTDLDAVRVRLKDLLEFRLLVEPRMAYLACRRATSEEIEMIADLSARFADAVCGDSAAREEDRELHNAIISAAHNDLMLRFLLVIDSAIADVHIFAPTNGPMLRNALTDHAVLINMISRRDAVGAMYAMSVHIHHAIQDLGISIDDDSMF